ncbi:MAG: tRNA (adenosine(37)-N6)-dimethylallyltransferase MiaA [Deltaproteobacteria bacterium]|nr:tRNA (adenosine(37)-N6)-dimethylallyltransferase MiaA [Deltaproteobacteria bacterium]
MVSSKIKLTIICGPTGVGKSRYAVALATARGAEIVSADSQQVYRGCDIGTGKLRPHEREGIPHHCLDLVEPNDPFTAARYIKAADRAIAEIRARKKEVIVVGGTGLYLRALVDGLCEAPAGDPAVRRTLAALRRREGVEALYARLLQRDPVAAQRIHPHHATRIMRALEVLEISGRSIMEWHEAHQGSPPRYETEWIGLTCERSELYARINARVERMLAEGLLDEARSLFERFGEAAPIFRSIGYREALQNIKEVLDISRLKSLIQKCTRNLAKRQLAWFGKETRVCWQRGM